MAYFDINYLDMTKKGTNLLSLKNILYNFITSNIHIVVL